MNEWDLFQQLSELDEELVLAAEDAHVYSKPWYRRGLRIALTAAIIALLVGTALAVGLGFGVEYGKETVYVQGISLDQQQPALSYHTAQLQLDMRPVEIKKRELLSRQLTEQWLKTPEKESFSGGEMQDEKGKALFFESITQLEDFFGLELMESPQLSELVRRIYVTLAVSDPEQAATSYKKTGSIPPDGLILYLSLRRGEDTATALDSRLVSESGITVFVPLTEAFAEKESIQYLYAAEEAGAFQESGLLTTSGNSLLLLENSKGVSYGRSGYAVWCNGGIAYLAHAKTYPDSYATPLSLLVPILEKLQ